MATASNAFCGICDGRHITKAADLWCSECDEGLCITCHEHHSISKATKQHNTIPIECFKKLPPAIANIVNYCANHDMKYTNYCSHHEKLCCPACISAEHKSCTGLLLLQDVIKTAKSSALLDSIEISVKDIKINIKNIIQDREQNLIIIHEQRQRFQDEMKQVRTKINAHIDTLEQKTLTDIDATENKVKTEIGQLVTKLTEKKKIADDLEQNISVIKVYASDMQAYIGSKSIETEVKREENYLQSLTDDESLCQIRLKLNIDEKLSNMESAIKSFGTVTIETELPLVVLKREKDKHAQIMSTLPQIVPKSFNEIKLSQISKFTCQKEKRLENASQIRGITVLPDGRIILADSSNKKLFIVNNDGMLDKSISCQPAWHGPFDVTYIKDNEVAVSMSSGIQIVNIHLRAVVESIITDGECRGIAFSNGILICCVKSKGIQCIQISTKTITTLVKVDESDRFGLCVHGNKIYETNFSNDVVSCYTLEGKQLWQFKNTSVLLYPTGITVDNNSNVYVATYYSNCVIVLSSDGKKFKQILTSIDGLRYPRALHFDEIKNNLLVANINMPIFCYEVS